MQYIGIDIAKNTHVVASRMADGAPHGKAFQFANDERGFRSLLERFAELEAGPDDCIVAMESTGHYWLALWSFLDDHGYPVAVVNPVMTDAFRKADSVRKTKTDAIDAFLIAEYARFKNLGPTPIAPEVADGAKVLTRYRAHLVSERTALKNRATAAADRVFPELARCFSTKHTAASRAILSEFGTPARVASTDIRTLTRVIGEASRGHHGREKAEEVKAAAKTSVGSTWASEALAFELAHITALIDHMDEEIAALDTKIAEVVEGPHGRVFADDPRDRPRERSGHPGRGRRPFPLRGALQALRLRGHRRLEVPIRKFDGTEQRMSSSGSSYLRHALMYAADKARMRDPYFGDYYDSLRARGKHHYVAVSGVARKLCGVILAVMKEQRPYESRPSIQSQQKEPTAG